MGITSIATKASRDLIRKSNKAEKDGEVVDWDKIFEEVNSLEAKGKNQEIKAIMEKRK